MVSSAIILYSVGQQLYSVDHKHRPVGIFNVKPSHGVISKNPFRLLVPLSACRSLNGL